MKTGTKVTIVSGSHRVPSMSRKVCDYLGKRLRSEYRSQPEIIDLGESPLPLWNEGYWNDTEEWKNCFASIAATLTNCDALVLVTPEWGGMVAPALKNFLLLLKPSMVGHKPALLVGVSASKGGAYPIAELRMSGYKKNQMCFIPDHIIVRNVENVLNDENPISEVEKRLRERIDYSLKELVHYSDALAKVRKDAQIPDQRFSSGM